MRTCLGYLFIDNGENTEAKSLFLLSKAQLSVSLNSVHGQAIGNTKYVDIL